MKDYKELTDLEFEELFESGKFPEKLFNHEAHLRLAYIHIVNSGADKAIDRIVDQLKSYVSKLGATDKYHETLTIASIRAIDHFLKKKPNMSFRELLNNYPKLTTDFRSLIQSHYSIDIFNSDEARAKYLEPDIQKF